LRYFIVKFISYFYHSILIIDYILELLIYFFIQLFYLFLDLCCKFDFIIFSKLLFSILLYIYYTHYRSFSPLDHQRIIIQTNYYISLFIICYNNLFKCTDHSKFKIICLIPLTFRFIYVFIYFNYFETLVTCHNLFYFELHQSYYYY